MPMDIQEHIKSILLFKVIVTVLKSHKSTYCTYPRYICLVNRTTATNYKLAHNFRIDLFCQKKGTREFYLKVLLRGHKTQETSQVRDKF